VLRRVSDENFAEAIVKGLVRRCPKLDLVRSRDEGLLGADDPGLLAWAAANQRVLLTHDRQTMPGHAYDRVVQARGSGIADARRVRGEHGARVWKGD
jgi:hypothetical protein